LKSPSQDSIERDIHTISINGWVRETRKQLSPIFKGEIQQPEQRQQEEIERLHQIRRTLQRTNAPFAGRLSRFTET
jgi:hypothetical protein